MTEGVGNWGEGEKVGHEIFRQLGRLQRAPRLLLGYQLYASVFGPTFFARVGGDRNRGTTSKWNQPGCGDAMLLGQAFYHGCCPVLGQAHVLGELAGTVRMSDHHSRFI